MEAKQVTLAAAWSDPNRREYTLMGLGSTSLSRQHHDSGALSESERLSRLTPAGRQVVERMYTMIDGFDRGGPHLIAVYGHTMALKIPRSQSPYFSSEELLDLDLQILTAFKVITTPVEDFFWHLLTDATKDFYLVG